MHDYIKKRAKAILKLSSEGIVWYQSKYKTRVGGMVQTLMPFGLNIAPISVPDF